MSVYTVLTEDDVSELLSRYDLGSYQNHKGISAGVENTNYFVSTDQQELVLTVFEKHSAGELPFFLELGEHLHNHHCAVPQPFRQASGEFILSVKGKPAVFFERVSGEHVEQTSPYLTEIARALATVHQSTQSFNHTRQHSHGLAWIKQVAGEVVELLSEQDNTLLQSALRVIKTLPSNLPKGVIHADLFHDNALFDSEKISGIIDWYFAGIDSYALDIAITINDWCFDEDNTKFSLNCQKFLEAYQQVRPLIEAELAAIPVLQIQSALRFWLSRLLAQQQHGSSTDTITVKDPEAMKQLIVRLMS